MRASGWANRRCAGGLAAWAALLAAPAVGAATPRPGAGPADGCSPEGGTPAVVRAVEDDLTLILEDGRAVKLEGIDPVQPTPGAPTLPATARTRLSSWLAGRTVTVRFSTAAADRWNRWPALVYARAGDEASPATTLLVTQALVDAGFARARPGRAVHECWPSLVAAEAGARAAALGLWSDPYYALRRADGGASTAEPPPGMAVVEGKVTHVGRSRAQLYVDLGPIHRAVALRLGRKAAFILGQLGVSENELVGLTLRARGLLDDRNGPVIEVVDADQIEVVRAAGPSEAGLTSSPLP